MRSDKEIGGLAVGISRYLQTAKCSPMEIYVILELIRHSVDRQIDDNVIKKKIDQESKKL